MSQNNEFYETEVLRFLVELFLIVEIISIIDTILLVFTIISTKLFIAFAIIAIGIILLRPISAVVTKTIISR